MPISKRDRKEERSSGKKISPILTIRELCPASRRAHAGYDISLRRGLVARMSAATCGHSRVSLRSPGLQFSRRGQFAFGKRPFSFSASLTFILKPPGITISPGFWSGLQAPSHLDSILVLTSRKAAGPPSLWELLVTV